jgi:uncharacterized protein YbjT (DUF2867 family)
MSYIRKTALVLGATGLIGKELINILTEQDQYEKIILVVRRPLNIEDGVCEQHVINFDELYNYRELFRVTDVFCCLGTTIKKAKTREAFRKVDYDYPIQAAEIAKEQGVEKFLIVSAMGADTKSLFFYSRVKGEVEESLRKLKPPSLSIFRPSLLLGNREEIRLGEKMAEKVSTLFNPIMVGPLLPYKPIHARSVATAMAIVAKSNKTGTNLFTSQEIEQLAKNL